MNNLISSLTKQKNREIVFITPTLGTGGAERIISLLASTWVKSGESVRIVELSSDFHGKNHYVTDPNVKLNKYNFSGNKYWRGCRILLFLLLYFAKHKDSQYIIFSGPIQVLLFFVSFALKNDIVLSERDNPYTVPLQKLFRWMRNVAFEKLARACVFQTIDAANYFSESVRDKGVIIPNPVNPDLPERWEGEKRKVIVGAGWLDKRKNWDMSIRAFAKFYKYHPDYILEIYGQGPDEDALKRVIEDLGMKGKILLKGFASNINELMRKCAIFVSSSNSEGISNSMIEAMAMGMPVVCTDCPIGGARMMIQNGVNGLLVPVGDVEALYLAFRRLVEEPGLAERLAKEAYKVREEYSIDRIAERWLDVIFPEREMMIGHGRKSC